MKARTSSSQSLVTEIMVDIQHADANSSALAQVAQSRTPNHGTRFIVRRLGLVPYEQTWQAMKSFTAARTSNEPDEIWLLEHPSIYTYGVAGRLEHLPATDCSIPVLKVDRGGQVTYHGPGQLVVYVLMDLQRRGVTVRLLVWALEQAVIDFLGDVGISGSRRDDAPGVYVCSAKIAALGLRIRNGCSYHGLSLNVKMNLSPFQAIDPCGYAGLKVTQLSDLGVDRSIEDIGERLAANLNRVLTPGN